MRLATCSYTEFRPEMGVPVRSTVSSPRWKLPYTIAGHAKLITPTRPMLKMEPDAYTLSYLRILNGNGIDLIRTELAALAVEGGSDRVVLLCYERLNEREKDGTAKFCHRSLFAQWYQAQTGEEVPELGKLPDSGHAHTPVTMAEVSSTLFDV